MTQENSKFLREASISAISIFITALVGIAGWGVSDRLHWAAKEQQIDDTAQTVNEIKTKMDSMPQTFVSRQEFDQIRELIQQDHEETISSLSHMGDRIDNLAKMTGDPAPANKTLGGYPTAPDRK